MAAGKASTISSIFNTLDLIAGGNENQTEGCSGGKGESEGTFAGNSEHSQGTTLSGHSTASALLLAKRKEDSLSRSSIQISDPIASSKSSVIFDHVSASSVASPKYWKGSGKSSGKKRLSSDGRVKVQHKSKPLSKVVQRRREKGERYSEKREWRLAGKAKAK